MSWEYRNHSHYPRGWVFFFFSWREMEKELEMSLIVLTLTACNYQLKHLIKIVTRLENFFINK